MKKILLVFVCFIIFVVNVDAIDINSDNAVLYNLNDNSVVFEKNKDQITSIASLTKIMTTLVAIENIENKDDTIIITYEMLNGLVEANASVVGLRVNQTVTYEDLLYSTLLASGADAVRALAITISGNENDFVTLMNKKAKDLNMNSTHFVNATGLDAKNHYSTVNDVAILVMEALKNETFKEIFTAKSYTFKDK